MTKSSRHPRHQSQPDRQAVDKPSSWRDLDGAGFIRARIIATGKRPSLRVIQKRLNLPWLTQAQRLVARVSGFVDGVQ